MTASVAASGTALPDEALSAASQWPAKPTGQRRRARRLLGLLGPVLLLGLWQVVASAGLVSTRLLPAPSTVGRALVAFFTDDQRQTLPGVVPFRGAGWEHLSASLTRCAVSWLLALAVGTAVGLLLGRSRLARDLLDPLLNALRAVPLFAWLPLALVWFGIGEGAARALIFVGALWPVLISVSDSTARVPRGHLETARMLGTPSRWLWWRVYLPSALPELVTGLRLSLTLAWTCVIVGELTGTDRGVVAMMNAAREVGRTEQILVGIVVFAGVGLVADLLLRRATRTWTRWALT